ncbi:MAG: ADP-ribosylglycohydrolase family protein [Bacteroidota bacterium]
MRKWLIYFSIAFLLACESSSSSSKAITLPKEEQTTKTTAPELQMSQAEYQDRILGALVGSAIGDAMGSPVEMWTTDAIEERYGFIDGLIPNIRPAGAEGPWKTNMAAGTGTDDTRWKQLMGYYFLSLPNGEAPSDFSFANFIVEQYEQLKQSIIEEDGLVPDRLESSTRYLQWMQEWVKVAEAYRNKDVREYANTLPKFYGGEMSCAGMLYAPLLGILYPSVPANAYESAWELSLFDLGYAKDITAMTAALSAASFTNEISAEQLLAIHYEVDEQNFADSRLIGRIVNGVYETALREHTIAKQTDSLILKINNLPSYFQGDSLRYQHLLLLYENMNYKLKDIPFHAHEIYMISLYALLYAEGNFMDAMCFITNFGRDNDTVAAVVGTILGIQSGYKALPPELAKTVIEAHKTELNIDLEDLAEQLSEQFYPQLKR